MKRDPVARPYEGDEPSGRLYSRALRHLPGGNTRSTVFVSPHPPYAMRGEGFWLTDVDGRRVVDLQNNYTSLIHGHANPAVTYAAVRALEKGSSFGLPTEGEVELAALLGDRVSAGERWRFTNSGTEAVMMAIRLARAVTGRDKILRFEGSYHGSSDSVVAGGGSEGPGIPSAAGADSIVLPVGDAMAFRSAIEDQGHDLACVLFDAMPNRAGLRPAEPSFVEMLREETARRGILFVWDEVLTFRVGRGGLQERYGVRPDVTTLGKIIGGGLPVGAIGGTAEIMAYFDPRGERPLEHGGTFSANPVTMAAGIAAMKIFEDDEIERLNLLGERLRENLADQGWSVTGSGSLVRIHVDDPARLWRALWEQKVLICANGLLCLSTPMDDQVVDMIVERLGRVAEIVDPSGVDRPPADS